MAAEIVAEGCFSLVTRTLGVFAAARADRLSIREVLRSPSRLFAATAEASGLSRKEQV